MLSACLPGPWCPASHLALYAGPVLFAQDALVELATVGTRELLPEVDAPWALVAAHPFLAIDDQLVGQLVARGRSVHQLDNGLDLLAPFQVGDADDGDVADRRVAGEDSLHLSREDVDAATDDHVLGPVADEEVAVLVHETDVAEGEGLPSADGCGELRVVLV